MTFTNPTLIFICLLTFGCNDTGFDGGNSARKDKSKLDADQINDVDSSNKNDDDSENKNDTSGSTGSKEKKSSDNDASNGGNSLEFDESDGCVAMPDSTTNTSSEKSGSQFRTTFFHEVVAVDPGKTGVDAAKDHGLTPFQVSPDSTLAKKDFEFKSQALKKIIADGVSEVEIFVFAHQFRMGLDKISIHLKLADETLSDTSQTNIYSAYGFLSIKNLVVKNGIPHGDVDIFSFNYDPAGNTALDQKIRASGASAQDGTKIVGPASENTTAKISKKGIELDGFKVTIEIGANSYDSVQYRAIRANLWKTNSPAKMPKKCD